MAHTYEELKGMTVAQLREIAQGIEHDALKGFSTMHKDHLVPALCAALGIDAHVHHVAHGLDKTKVKAQIRKLKEERNAARAAKDPAKLPLIHDEIRRLKHLLRRAALQP